MGPNKMELSLLMLYSSWRQAEGFIGSSAVSTRMRDRLAPSANRPFSPPSMSLRGVPPTALPQSLSTAVVSRSSLRPTSVRGISSLQATAVNLEFGDLPNAQDVDVTVVIAKKAYLSQHQQAWPTWLDMPVDPATIHAMVQDTEAASSTTTFVQGQRLTLAALPDEVTRHNHPWSVHTVTDLVASTTTKGQHVRLVFAGVTPPFVVPLASAVAKAHSVYSQKTLHENGNDDTKAVAQRTVSVSFLEPDSSTVFDDASTLRTAAIVAQGVQLAARLVDTPPSELTTDAYAAECQALADSLEGVTMTQIVGDELDEKGYGGIFGVGKAAECPPRLIIMEYNPPGVPTERVALVGKAIVYDTGGLSLKPKTGMPGMKKDMGGSAGLLAAFSCAVQLQATQKITLLLCMAENAIGPKAFRNDDILRLYSGKTVEVNNCDAEGRLVLGDGVAHATKHIEDLDLVIDMATLTGAQHVTTGKKHGGVLCNQEDLEKRVMAAGLHSGDLVYPLLYAPELLQQEFQSHVADMKNSVADRSNAQSSCAGHFIESHLCPEYTGGWVHIDMSGPASVGERGTGYGVGLILSLLDVPGMKG